MTVLVYFRANISIETIFNVKKEKASTNLFIVIIDFKQRSWIFPGVFNIRLLQVSHSGLLRMIFWPLASSADL